MEHTTLTQTLPHQKPTAISPCRATSNMMGHMEIMRLRSESEQALGDDFEIKEFHDLLLKDGTIPLVMMREKVERWIEE